MDFSKLKNKKVLVTGGAGFIGSHICEELVQIGAEVISIDDYSAGKHANLEFLKDFKNFTELKKDICDKEGMDELFHGCDVVFNNAASKKNICLYNPAKDLAVNAGGTLNLLEFAKKHKVKKFVHASTGSVYGEPTIFPSDENHPLKPVSYYGVSKLAGERYVDVFSHLYGLDMTILRYFHVYGPRQESNEFGGVVSIFLRNLLENKPLIVSGHGNQVRTFTYVKDLVRANLAAATNPKSSNQVYNAAAGIKVTINELAQGLVDIMGKNVPIEHGEPLVGDIMFFDVSNKKIINDLGISFEKDFWGTMKKTTTQYLEYFEKLNRR
ncbi:MAG: NAD-dependent epimerase/dehydratase family protein [Pseudobdellovibrio sp.]